MDTKLKHKQKTEKVWLLLLSAIIGILLIAVSINYLIKNNVLEQPINNETTNLNINCDAFTTTIDYSEEQLLSIGAYNIPLLCSIIDSSPNEYNMYLKKYKICVQINEKKYGLCNERWNKCQEEMEQDQMEEVQTQEEEEDPVKQQEKRKLKKVGK